MKDRYELIEVTPELFRAGEEIFRGALGQYDLCENYAEELPERAERNKHVPFREEQPDMRVTRDMWAFELRIISEGETSFLALEADTFGYTEVFGDALPWFVEQTKEARRKFIVLWKLEFHEDGFDHGPVGLVDLRTIDAITPV